MNKYKKTISHSTELTILGLIKRSFAFLGVSAILALAFTLVISAIFFNLPDPTRKIHIASLLSMYLTAFFSGLFLSLFNKQRYFSGGLILGLMLFVINLILSLCFNDSLTLIDYIWKLLIPVVCILGSMLGTKKERKSFRKRRFLR